MIIELDIKFNLAELRDYYNIVQSDYHHLRWTFNNDVIGAEKHKHDGIYGWGIQSNLNDLTIPCPPYNIHKNKTDHYRNTELVFGFAQKIIDFFPGVRQLGIAGHPSGIEIAEHTDSEEYFKIHIPIFSNSDAYFIFSGQNYNMDPGKMYIVETKLMHGTNNKGLTDRVHMLFKCPRNTFEQVQAMTGVL